MAEKQKVEQANLFSLDKLNVAENERMRLMGEKQPSKVQCATVTGTHANNEILFCCCS